MVKFCVCDSRGRMVEFGSLESANDACRHWRARGIRCWVELKS